MQYCWDSATFDLQKWQIHMTQANTYKSTVSNKRTWGKAPKENKVWCIQGTGQGSGWELKLQHNVKIIEWGSHYFRMAMRRNKHQRERGKKHKNIKPEFRKWWSWSQLHLAITSPKLDVLEGPLQLRRENPLNRYHESLFPWSLFQFYL